MSAISSHLMMNVTATVAMVALDEAWSTGAATTASVCVGLITGLIITSNILNIIVWRSVRNVAPTTRVFFINLSVSDLLVGAVACAPAIYSVYTTHWPYGDIWCQISGITHGTSVTISIWSISCVAIDRCIAVKWPTHYQTKVTTKRCLIILALLWLFAVMTFSAPVFIKEGHIYYQFEPQYGLCGLYWEYRAFCIVTGLYIPLLCGSILLFTSVGIARALKKSGEISQAKSKADRHREFMNRRALKVIVLTSIAYFICWGPYVTLVLAEAISLRIKDWSPDWLSFVTIWAANTNSGVNVVIYSLTNTAFNVQLRNILVKLCGRCIPNLPKGHADTSVLDRSVNMPLTSINNAGNVSPAVSV